MSRYASNTSVSSAKSRDEIERTLGRYGAGMFAYASTSDAASIAFEVEGRRVQINLTLPDRNDREFTHTPAKRQKRHTDDAERAWEQGCRQRWRALALVVKAKLEAVEAGISTIEREFLADVMLPSGETVERFLGPQIQHAYDTGAMPTGLLALESGVA